MSGTLEGDKDAVRSVMALQTRNYWHPSTSRTQNMFYNIMVPYVLELLLRMEILRKKSSSLEFETQLMTTVWNKLSVIEQIILEC